jgi:hypothetical protein
MDNLIHASAAKSDAEREIKLWFTPADIPPSMRVYPTEVCDSHYYMKDNKLSLTHEAGSRCLVAPGDVVWKTDLEALNLLYQGSSSASSLETIAAKYLINI